MAHPIITLDLQNVKPTPPVPPFYSLGLIRAGCALRQAQIEYEKEVDEFFSIAEPKERITNAIREASPTTRKRHNRYRK